MFVDALVIKISDFLNSLSPWKSVIVNSLSWYLVLTCFIPDIISYLPLLLHACTDLKSIYPDFVRRKGLPFTEKKSIDISTLWWCLEMVGEKGILGIFFWFSGLIMMDFICMMGICGP